MATAAAASIASRNCKREEAATKLIWRVLRNVQPAGKIRRFSGKRPWCIAVSAFSSLSMVGPFRLNHASQANARTH